MEDATAEALSADSTLATPLTMTVGKSQFPHVVSYMYLWRVYLVYSGCSSTLSRSFLVFWCEINTELVSEFS